MENVRRYVEVKLETDPERVRTLTAHPRCQEVRVFDEQLVAIKMRPATVRLFKPIYSGFSVLDLSKLLMYEFHYDYVKQKYGDNAALLFTVSNIPY